MSLITYDKTLSNYWDGGKEYGWPVVAIDRKEDAPLPELKPGMWVEVPDEGGRGIVVAVNDEQLTVLWSEPAPTLQERLAKQIQEEIDAEILRDLMNV